MTLGTGNEAAVGGALAAGCHFFAGYPITPSSEILEEAVSRFPEHGRIALQAESEIAAIHMVAGASLAGYRAMTASNGVGISLMSEALSFFSGMSSLPGVVVCQQRWGPGDGSMGPGQDSYRQVTRGAGHGDMHLIVLAPSSAQETADLVQIAFDLADTYGIFVVVLGDQITALATEVYKTPPPRTVARRADAIGSLAPSTDGTYPLLPELSAADSKGGEFAAIAQVARRWEARYEEIREVEVRWDSERRDDEIDVLIVAYGSLARIASAALDLLATAGYRAAVFRPISLWPFPEEALRADAVRAERVVVAELSMGQLVEDVRLSLGRRPDSFVNWLGGEVPGPVEFVDELIGKLSTVTNGALQ